ncbi:MAG TPA: hypothetical protein ENK21_10465, partial [Trueperaceae bacterium]|nr:hypothetical protein [Trueperaceae bacterium]
KKSGIKTPELGKYLDDLARLVPELSNSKAILINPELARARLFEALSLYFEQIIKGFNIKGFALAFDDLQWLDNSSLDFLIYLAKQEKIKFIAAFRKFEKNQYLAQTISSLKASQSITLIGLEPLSTKDLEKLLASLMNANYGPPIFSKWLAKNTNGNPMFVLESLKNMFETGTLRAENKLWHTDIDEITKDYSEIEIPNIIEETILRRYSKLSPKTQRVLQITSAINQNFSPKQVSQILGLSEWAVIECFEEAQHSAIIFEDRFQHDLLRQTIYKQLSPLKAKLLHKKLAEQLDGNTNASIIAEHWYYADHAEKAAQIWLSAAIKLRNKGLVFEAISLIRNLSKYAKIPKDWHERLERILIACYLDLMEFDKLFELSQNLLKTSTDKLIIASAELFLSCYYRYAQSDLDKDLEHIQNANDLAEYVFRQIENDAELYEEFWYHLQVSWTDYYLKKGDYEKALQYSLELVGKCGNCDILERAIDAYNMAGESYRQLADNKKALEYFNKAKELGKDMGQNALSPTINLLRISAELGQAEPYLSEAEELLKDYEFLGTDFANYIVGKVHFELNNNQKALFYLQKSIEANQGVHAPESYALLATIYKKQKQRAKSREFFKKAYQALERNKNQEISEATKQLIIENASKTMVQKIRQ